MKKDEIFFGTEGLTSTSANYIANLAKEIMKKEETDLESITFFHTQVAPINNANKATLSLGTEEQEYLSIESKLNHIIKLKKLIAWLREGIKAKENLDKEVTKKPFDEVCKELGIESLYGIVDPEPYTEEEHMGTLSLGERNKIYALQTEAATLGKLVHENGSLSKARNELHRIQKAPSEVKQNGMQTLLYTYEPSMDEEKVDELFFRLQNRYREVQAELNSHMHAISEAVKLENERRDEEDNTFNTEQIKKNKLACQKVDAWRDKERHRISNLKIIIPNDLRETYEEVRNWGK